MGNAISRYVNDVKSRDFPSEEEQYWPLDHWIVRWLESWKAKPPTVLGFNNRIDQKMHRFKELEIWKLSGSFCSDIYKQTSSFTEVEKFGLCGQLRRAAISMPSNIAEGCSRKSNKDFSRFLGLAMGSLTQLLIPNGLGFLPEETLNKLLTKPDSIIKMTSKFNSTLK